MNLTIYYIHATIAREFSTPTFPNPPDRPRLLFLRFLNFHLPPLWAFKKNQVPYLQSLAASFSKTWGWGRTPNQVFAINNFQTLFFPHRGYFRNSYFSGARPGTAHTASDRPRRNARKHNANTEWLRLAPKYCQKAGWAPG